MTKATSRRSIPAVETVLQALGPSDLPRPSVVRVVRKTLAELRSQKEIPKIESILARVQSALAKLRSSRIQPVINGTGIIIHTNLGRAPLGPAVAETLNQIATNYSNLEYDLAGGERGGRGAYLEHNLALLCGAEAATVVNNCAAALFLILRHFASGERNEVIISRGELVQIGGGFRIPEILEASGAVLREVGTTNKTSTADYATVVGPKTALILKVHRSNFFMDGFVESAPTEEIAALARRRRVPFIEDLGSGAVMKTEQLAGLEHEPTPAEVLKRGVDLVCCSGDKLFGGVQAGLIAGRARWIGALKREPFFRALRCDKLILSALQTTVDLHLDGQVSEQIPLLTMLRLSFADLVARAGSLAAVLAGLPLTATIGQGESQIGGGALPRSTIPSVTLDLAPTQITLKELAARLRAQTPPVVGCISAGRFRLDLRTIFPRQDQALIQAIRAAVSHAGVA